MHALRHCVCSVQSRSDTDLLRPKTAICGVDVRLLTHWSGSGFLSPYGPARLEVDEIFGVPIGEIQIQLLDAVQLSSGQLFQVRIDGVIDVGEMQMSFG